MTNFTRSLLNLPAELAFLTAAATAQTSADFEWPQGRRGAVSLSFDDARESQPDIGAELFERFKTKVTFYVVPSRVEPRLEGWKRLAKAGHEIANHSLVHPCSGNFAFSRDRALEDYDLGRLREELIESNRLLEEMFGNAPTAFAYPCGQSTVGRGVAAKSYVPVVAELFASGRGWLDEAANDPSYVDMAQLTGIEMDGKDFDDLLPLLKSARENGQWLVLGGHEINHEGRQTTRVGMLEQLIPYLEDPSNGFWVGTVGEVAQWVIEQREQTPAGRQR